LSGYHSNLRFDTIPNNGDSLWARAGRGQFGINYASPTGTGFKGMPTVYEACWDTGLEAFGAKGVLEYSAAVVYGVPSVPMMSGQENNGAPGLEGRIGLSRLPGPLFGARVGASAARGPYMPRTIILPRGKKPEDFNQVVYGFDAEYGLGPAVVRGEAVWNRWELPANDTPEHWLPSHVDNTAYYAEAKVTVAPGIFLGGRYDSMTFDKITSPSGKSEEWDASLHRVEVGAGWRPARQWELRYVYQAWRYEEYKLLNSDLYALQLRVAF
jgi:hypothetical protein